MYNDKTPRHYGLSEEFYETLWGDRNVKDIFTKWLKQAK